MKHHGLVPERRTDKRGVTITRWVKPPKPPTAAGRPLPAAVAQPREYTAEDDSPRMEGLFEVLLAARQTAMQRDRAISNIHFLDETVPDLLDRVAAVCTRDTPEATLWRLLLGAVDYPKAERRIPGETRVGIKRALAVFPLSAHLAAMRTPCHSDIDDMEHAYDVVTALTAASGRSEVPPDTTRAMALVAHLHGIRPSMSDEAADLPGLYAAAAEDIDFIGSRWDEVEPLIPLLNERRSYDRELVAALLDGGPCALASGLL